MTRTNPPLIPWEDVPEGPVWYWLPGDERWHLGRKLGVLSFLREDGGQQFIEDNPHYQFAAAEQQPGQHAAEIADNRRLREGLTTWLDMLRNSPDTAVVTRAHVEDRLAALLSHGCLRYEA